MKIWYKNSDPTKVISFGKDSGEADESFFKHDGEPVYGFDHKLYDIVNGVLVAKSQKAVDAIKAQRALDQQKEATTKANRVAEISNKLTSMTPAQLDSYIDTGITDLKSAKVYLKRLTRIVQALAKEQED
ncbi:hypothetical protein MNBD_NITROSPINAE04-866 [hydrothermal vent metagenome]|uniref:Uncharacterized protein n=1 Tax=hydrothermal vent metagenome TaxID=652676 RepID=A0A3B1BFM6_9ZZZZ